MYEMLNIETFFCQMILHSYVPLNFGNKNRWFRQSWIIYFVLFVLYNMYVLFLKIFYVKRGQMFFAIDIDNYVI